MGTFIYRTLIWRFPPSSHDPLLSLPVSICLPFFCLRNYSRPNRQLVFCLGALSPPRDRSRRIPLLSILHYNHACIILFLFHSSWQTQREHSTARNQYKTVKILRQRVLILLFLAIAMWTFNSNPLPSLLNQTKRNTQYNSVHKEKWVIGPISVLYYRIRRPLHFPTPL